MEDDDGLIEQTAARLKGEFYVPRSPYAFALFNSRTGKWDELKDAYVEIGSDKNSTITGVAENEIQDNMMEGMRLAFEHNNKDLPMEGISPSMIFHKTFTGHFAINGETRWIAYQLVFIGLDLPGKPGLMTHRFKINGSLKNITRRYGID